MARFTIDTRRCFPTVRSWLAMCLLSLFCGASQAQSFHLVPGDFNNGIPTFVYDPASGSSYVLGDGLKLTTLEIISASGVFQNSSVDCQLPFDICTQPTKRFFLRPAGAERFELGESLPAGLSFEFLQNDLTFRGSILPSGPLPGIDIPIPEPATHLLFVSGGLCSCLLRRRSRACR